MPEIFVEEGVETSSKVSVGPDAAQAIREALGGRQVCPFCGTVREEMDGPCSRCSMENSSASRQATKARIGPWYVFQTRNPAAPGMKFETLLGFVRKGRVKARSIVRGPTTHQLWRFAAHVKGVSREFGICYSCGGPVERIANLCPHCNRLQEPPADPDAFLEGQETQAAQAKPSAGRAEGPTPQAAEDLVAPALGFERSVVPSLDPLDASAQDDKAAKKGADGYLSPQDLAAAFNLDFRPKAKHGRQTQGQVQESSGQGSGFYGGRSARPRRRRKWGRYVALLLVVCGFAGGAYALYTKPPLRALAMDYANQGLSWTKQKWTQWKSSAGPSSTGSTQHPSAVTPAAPTADATANQPSGESKRIQPAQTLPSSTAPQQGKPTAWDQLYDQRTSSAVKTAPDEPPAKSPPATIDQMRTLYWAAIDAEAQGDFATAVKKYEQIKQLPQELWPRDLSLRLDQAKKQVHP